MTSGYQAPLKPPVVVLTGAGISTESGIPDFRGPGGVWERFDMDEFTIERFHADPDRFWRERVRLITAMDHLDAEPNPAHRVLAEAVRDGRVEWLVTQNVDGLHAKAGTPPDRLIELHGNGAHTVCLDCGEKEDVRRSMEKAAEGTPRCDHCGGLLKPDVVLFGEPVPKIMRAAEEVGRAGTLITVGTSLIVHPAAGLVMEALRAGADVHICNRDPTPYDAVATVHGGTVSDSVARLLSPDES